MSQPTAPQPAPRRASDNHHWWYNVLFGLACAVGGVVIFAVVAHMESNGGTVRMNFLFVWVYDTLGKWGVLGVMEAVAVLLIAMGVRQRGRERAAAKGVTIV